MKTKALSFTGIMAATLIALFALSSMTAFAAEDTKRPWYRKQVRDDVQEYRAELSEEDKETLQEAHELRKEGDHDAAKELLDDAGITPPRAAVRAEFKEERAEVRDAIKSGDYDAFLDATADGPVDVQLTEEQFDGLAEIQDLREEGNYEEARALAEELELPKLRKRHAKKFMNDLSDEQKETLAEAKELAQGGDKEAAKELLEEAGIEMPAKKPGLFKRIGKWFRGSDDAE